MQKDFPERTEGVGSAGELTSTNQNNKRIKEHGEQPDGKLGDGKREKMNKNLIGWQLERSLLDVPPLFLSLSLVTFSL